MNVVVLGAGTVGQAVAELLCSRGVDVCVIDESAEVLRRVEERLDVQTVCGSAYDVARLFQTGIQAADLCLAVTSRDEVNLVGASIAREMGARRSVARVFNPVFRDTSTFDYQRHFSIDRLISLEQLTAQEIAKHIRSNSAQVVESFARGAVSVLAIQVAPKAKAAGVPLHQLKLPPTVRVGLITGDTRSIIPGGNDAALEGEQVTLLGAHAELEKVARLFEGRSSSRSRVIIAGGGETGLNLARLLEGSRCQVTILEHNAERCEFIAERLPKSTVLHADVKSRADLEEARVGKCDAFVACTGHDEENIVCGVEAKELGANRLITIVRSPDYANVLERLGIDVAVSPRDAMARQIFGLVASGPVRERCPIADDTATVMEVEVQKGAPADGRTLRQLSLTQSLVAAVERSSQSRVPRADDELHAGDSVIVLVQQQAESRILELFGG